MTNEIKEIKFIEYDGIEGYIELMKHDVEPLNNPEVKNIDLCYSGKDIKAVLDYITNLQEENERLKRQYAKEEKKLFHDNEILQQRIDKAINYILDNICCDTRVYTKSENVYKVVDILRGDE